MGVVLPACDGGGINAVLCFFSAGNRLYNSYSHNKLDLYVALRYIEFVSSNLLLKKLDSARAARSAGFFLPYGVKVSRLPVLTCLQALN
jgi:hypothetical protein